MTYDDFHKDAERIYLVRMDDCHFGGHYSDFVPYALGNHLKTTYTEIEDFCASGQNTLFIKNGKQITEYPMLMPDTTFIRMMDIKVLEGDNQFFLSTSPEKSGIAITEKAAQDLFGTTGVIGETITDNNRRYEYRISAIVSDWGEHSNFKYAFMGRTNNGSWVMPINGQPGEVQGIKLEENGEASSINMHTLIYKEWEQQGDQLYLTVKSIGNGIEIEGVDTLKIDKLTPDSLVLSSNYGYTLEYVRQK